MIYRTWVKKLLWACLYCTPLFSLAADATSMVQQMTTGMSSALMQSSQLSDDDLSKIINQHVMPHIDKDIMAESVVGKSIWSSATPEQKAQFTKQFELMMIKTYSAGLQSYNGEKIKVFPARPDPARPGVMQVKSTVTAPDGKLLLDLIYDAEEVGGQWVVIDVVMTGVSMAQNYRSQFHSILVSKGLPDLIAQLEKFNAGK